jgi:hypothetical protein
MQFVTLLLKDGNSIEVNPELIAYVERLEEYHVRIVFSGGETIEISDSHSCLLERLRNLK